MTSHQNDTQKHWSVDTGGLGYRDAAVAAFATAAD
jgi:hypothetical protein